MQGQGPDQAEIEERVAELEQFSAQLDEVRASLDAEPPPDACRADLTCCVPESVGVPVAIELQPRRVAANAGSGPAPALLSHLG